MGQILHTVVFETRNDLVSSSYYSLFDIPSIDIDGNYLSSLREAAFGKKAVLVVNVASE
jgi:hypothetical protein